MITETEYTYEVKIPYDEIMIPSQPCRSGELTGRDDWDTFFFFFHQRHY